VIATLGDMMTQRINNTATHVGWVTTCGKIPVQTAFECVQGGSSISVGDRI